MASALGLLVQVEVRAEVQLRLLRVDGGEIVSPVEQSDASVFKFERNQSIQSRCHVLMQRFGVRHKNKGDVSILITCVVLCFVGCVVHLFSLITLITLTSFNLLSLLAPLCLLG